MDLQGALLTVAAGLVLILIGLIFFAIAALSHMVRRGRKVDERSLPHRCSRCGETLIPLLDGSHRFVGEAVCLRGHLLTGLMPPPERPSAGPV